MQGIFLAPLPRRPKSKKEVKELVAQNPDHVVLEATSVFGNEYDGPVSEAPAGTYYFVGPNPYTKRTFYGSLTVRPDGKVTVK